MCEVITCGYCLEQYFDFNVWVMIDDSLMCKDCVRNDVPIRGEMAVA